MILVCSDEWLKKAEIGICALKWSQQGVDNFGSSTLRFTPRWSVFRLIQEFHYISTLPTSPYKYNEWLKKVEIGICALKWSQQGDIQSRVGSKLAWPLSTSHTKIE
eukprot:scaffold1208_cov43-Cyclotella_meneghiniana.AAC.1